MRIAVFVAGVVLLASASPQEKVSQPQLAPVQPMPADRAYEAYAIYSQLLPGNQIEWGNEPRSFWLMEEATTAQPLNVSCIAADGMLMNPHRSVKPPVDRQADFSEVLADYDAHCHDRYLLDASQFRLALPVHLLDDAGQRRYEQGVMHYMPPSNDIMRAPATPDEFKGAAGMHRFTAVFFNPAHTLALTEIGMYCGSLCGNWRWVALEKKNGTWSILPWMSTYTIS